MDLILNTYFYSNFNHINCIQNQLYQLEIELVQC